MKQAAILVFPGTNRETDMAHALTLAGFDVRYIFCTQDNLPNDLDLIALAGGFSYGDYLRSGAIAANTAIIPALKKYADCGGNIIGVCNGFQILCEIGLLPGALIHNQSGRFICTATDIKVVHNQSHFTQEYEADQIINLPIAHGEGNYFADSVTLARLKKNNQILFEYVTNPNGSCHNIAGITNEAGTILGMMPHPENHVDVYQKNSDGLGIFYSLKNKIIA
ncbi:MAG: phosphoribosylformylglycinamidine synthase [Alphaproteobacteria bacterium]|jgi:phosphoribosylformylglycinamidine synthase